MCVLFICALMSAWVTLLACGSARHRTFIALVSRINGLENGNAEEKSSVALSMNIPPRRAGLDPPSLWGGNILFLGEHAQLFSPLEGAPSMPPTTNTRPTSNRHSVLLNQPP